MRAVVTGAAGFIGSHLVERLLDDGVDVVAVDSFTSYYARADKERNADAFARRRGVRFLEGDLNDLDLDTLFAGADVVAHLAAQPGVRGSFGAGFSEYVRANVLATQRVLDAAARSGVGRVVYASSSSVYGDAETYPCIESATPTRPRSPYGVTKRTCEDLASVYRGEGLEVVGLRYFTVYGPRQRPDMAFRRLCEALVGGPAFRLNGDGSQSRDFTFVDDAVDATVRALTAPAVAPVLNIGGGEEASLSTVLTLLESISGRSIPLVRVEAARGDVVRTAADCTLARQQLEWRPTTSLAEGLVRQYEWVAAHGTSVQRAVAA
jgi:UDP-glucuronate 4-epimerase